MQWSLSSLAPLACAARLTYSTKSLVWVLHTQPCAVLAVLSSATGCLEPALDDSTNSIVNGQLDTVHESVVAVTNGTGCSATVIAPRVLLTAAHCFDPNPPNGIALTFSSASYRVHRAALVPTGAMFCVALGFATFSFIPTGTGTSHGQRTLISR